MKSKVKLLFFFLILFPFLTIFGCNGSVTNVEDVPGAPQLIETPNDTSLVEIGIDAFTRQDQVDAENIQVDWRQGAGVFPDSFRIFRGVLNVANEKEFRLLAVVSSNNFNILNNDTIFTFVDSDSILVDRRYFYYLTAVGVRGNESPPSDTLDYLLLQKPGNPGVIAKDPARPQFSWTNVGVGNYVLKILEANSDNRVWISVVENSFGDISTVQYNYDFKAVQDTLTKGIRYKWRVDAVGIERNSGSESRWRDYLY
ncbi:MAG: hypothetical protein ACE5HO_14070 [bacterium]